jgi:biopolymer transport protein ExbB
VQRSRCPLARILHAAWSADEDPQQTAAKESMDNAIESVALAMERRLTWISTLSHVAMSTGLLGTVWGLVNSFLVIAQGGEAPPPHELAAGVSMALVTTIFGLLTAVPGLLAHGVLQPMSNGLLHRLQETARNLFQQYYLVTTANVPVAADQDSSSEAEQEED